MTSASNTSTTENTSISVIETDQISEPTVTVDEKPKGKPLPSLNLYHSKGDIRQIESFLSSDHKGHKINAIWKIIRENINADRFEDPAKIRNIRKRYEEIKNLFKTGNDEDRKKALRRIEHENFSASLFEGLEAK